MEYNDDSIKVLKGLLPVRQNPAMFVGDSGSRGLHHIIYEVLDNSIDEHMAGFCSEISVTLKSDGSVCVEDNGRGYPTGVHPKEKKPTIEVILTTLHSGSKFDNQTYRVSGGLHGVGVSCTNALSEQFHIEVFRNNKTYYMSFERGNVVTPLKTKRGIKGKTLKGKTGTKITFKPDSEIFSTTNIDSETISNRLLELSYLNPGLKIYFEDEHEERKETFCTKNGLREYITFLNKGKNTLYSTPFYCEGENEGVLVKVAIQHVSQDGDNIVSFANAIRTIDGGTHVAGLRSALTRVINQYALEHNINKHGERLDGKDIRSGLSAVISVYVPSPKFEGQTKGRLTNLEIQGIVSSLVGEKLKSWLNKKPTVAQRIIKQALVSYEARMAAKRAANLVKKQAMLEVSELPGKLKGCRSKNPKERELFIVEGASAGGNAEAARDSEYQAILPLRGKIINTHRANIEKIIKNPEINSLIRAIGTGIKLDGGNGFDIEKLNYHKIIIATDADVDGAHIRVLLLNFFFKYMTPLIENGYIWIAKPPLYRVFLTKNITWRGRKGKEIFIDDDNELNALLESNAKIVADNGIQRFKGLGELNAEQLAYTVMNRNTRRLVQVKMEDFDEADNLFDILLGKDVNIRYDYIKQHSDMSYHVDV